MKDLSVKERRDKIMELLNKNGRVHVNDLSELFGVSKVIIRIDLSELEKEGLLSRVHGGAITSYKDYYDMSLVQRSNTNSEEKQLIAQKLNDMIIDNTTIMINAGTTPLFIIRALEKKKLTIVTNSIALALEGAKNPNFKIILLGGDVDSNYQFTYGLSALKILNQYRSDYLILSVDGVDAANGISTFYYQEAELLKSMMKQANHTIVVADHSKIGRLAFAEIASIKDVDTLITTSKSPTDCLQKLKAKGISVIIGDE